VEDVAAVTAAQTIQTSPEVTSEVSATATVPETDNTDLSLKTEGEHTATSTTTEAKVEEKKEEPLETFEVEEEVETTWGRGLIKEMRGDGSYVVQSNSWLMANGQTPTFYVHVSTTPDNLICHPPCPTVA